MLSVVAPAYNEADALPAFLSRLLDVLEEVGGDWELVLVDDGSRDGTWQEIERAARDEPRIRGIRLSRNFGHQLALTAGMSVARGDAVITLDSDLQHPPEAIPALLGAARKGYDVVYAVRSPQDAAGWWKRFTARVFYAMLNRLSSLELPEGAADYRLMSRRVVDVLVEMPERHRFLRGLTRWAGFEQSFIEYHRGRRETGETKYTLRRMVLFAWDAVVSFSSFPLRVASVVGACVSLLGWLYLVYVLVEKVAGRTVQGWTSVTAAVLVLGGAQLVFLGILGQYVGRMYDDVKRRPLFLIAEDTRDS
ncbi:MAG TPA: glycosyltransferase family 2 protein [Gaiellaceae bacterium]|nr:glycosyltransferase family 2 protein [Gaiellaceae bacterium]